MPSIAFIYKILLAGTLVVPMAARPQSSPMGSRAPNSKTAIRQRLQNIYVPAQRSNNQIVQIGSILTVQQDGLGGLPFEPAFLGLGIGYFGNNLKDGRVRHDRSSDFLLTNKPGFRNIQAGERAYLLKVDISETSVTLIVETCGACDPSQGVPDPVVAGVTFPFKKGFLESAPIEQIVGTIGQALAFDQLPGPTDAPAPLNEAIPQTTQPPPPPDVESAAPVRIELGQTIDQVTAVLGQPAKMVDVGSKKIFVYKDLKITFLDGKVSDVQ
jgi:hypothetical protein